LKHLNLKIESTVIFPIILITFVDRFIELLLNIFHKIEFFNNSQFIFIQPIMIKQLNCLFKTQLLYFGAIIRLH